MDAYAQGQRGPCADDIAKLCKDVNPGGGRLANCLKEHEKELSPACAASIKETRKKLKDAHQVCADDVQKFCKDIKSGQGRIVNCLREHQNDLSPACQATMAQPRKPK
jgi:peptide subunit release factor 1 (eRF1)